MSQEIIADLFEYGIWANERLLERAAGVSESQLRRPFTQGALPILENFVHLVSSDRRWFSRWEEAPLPAGLTVNALPTLEAVRQAWQHFIPARRTYIASLDEAALRQPIRWQDGGEWRQLRRWQGLVQCANHGTQHRSEIAAMLTDCGHSPGDLDFGLWCRAVRP
jgi:uncharacterized damage-inducible protein DinB